MLANISKLCPYCFNEVLRRKNGCCPYCKKQLFVYKPRGNGKESVWIAESPNLTELVDALEGMIRTQLGLKEFHFQDRKQELGVARTLFEKCDRSQSLALEVIRAYFESNRTMIWYKPRSMCQVVWDQSNDNGHRGCFSIALALAKSHISREMDRNTLLMQESI